MLITRVSCIFTLIGECTLMDLCLLDIKLIIRIVIEDVKNIMYFMSTYRNNLMKSPELCTKIRNN